MKLDACRAQSDAAQQGFWHYGVRIQCQFQIEKELAMKVCIVGASGKLGKTSLSKLSDQLSGAVGDLPEGVIDGEARLDRVDDRSSAASAPATGGEQKGSGENGQVAS